MISDDDRQFLEAQVDKIVAAIRSHEEMLNLIDNRLTDIVGQLERIAYKD
jgi:hypothetical protein